MYILLYKRQNKVKKNYKMTGTYLPTQYKNK